MASVKCWCLDEKSNIMKIVLSLILALFCSATLAATDSATALSELLGRYKTYQANFTQATYYANNMRPQKSSGRLYMQRPGKFRWEVDRPMKQIIIANGSTLWIYDIELQQVTKQHISMDKGGNPAALLSGDVGKLMKNYKVSSVIFEGKNWYQLIPRSKDSSFVKVLMFFKNNQLVSIRVKNNLSQISDFYFSKITLNKELSPLLFNFKPPPGVDVLK